MAVGNRGRGHEDEPEHERGNEHPPLRIPRLAVVRHGGDDYETAPVVRRARSPRARFGDYGGAHLATDPLHRGTPPHHRLAPGAATHVSRRPRGHTYTGVGGLPQ